MAQSAPSRANLIHTLRRPRAYFVLALGLLAASCKVGPNYRAPRESVPAGYSAAPATQPVTSQPVTPLDQERWWAALRDQHLDGLVQRAVDGNYDLAIATARVAEARATQDIAFARLLPSVGGTLGSPPGTTPMYGRVSQTLDSLNYVPGRSAQSQFNLSPGGIGPAALALAGRNGGGATLSTGAIGSSAGIALTPNGLTPEVAGRASPGSISLAGPGFGSPGSLQGRDQFTFAAGINATWEADVFGGLRRALEAATADADAVVESRNDVLLMLVADVVSTYADLRAFQWRVEIADVNIQRQTESFNLVDTRFKTGIGNELDVAQAQRQLATTIALKPPLIAGVANARHRLGVLLGNWPAALDQELATRVDLPNVPKDAPAGLPSELLRRRPDVRRAERELAAATARVGVATAAFFPKFYLNGSFGPQTSDIREMLNADSLTWSAGPGMRWPIFEYGLIGEIHLQEQRAVQSLWTYRQILLIAMREVEDAIADYNAQSERTVQVRLAADAALSAYKLSLVRYDTGLVDYLNVLDSLRTLYDLEDQVAVAQQSLVVNFVRLYRSLGGGWEGFVPALDARATSQPVFADCVED